MLCGGVIISLQQEAAAGDRSPGALPAQASRRDPGGRLLTATGRQGVFWRLGDHRKRGGG